MAGSLADSRATSTVMSPEEAMVAQRMARKIKKASHRIQPVFSATVTGGSMDDPVVATVTTLLLSTSRKAPLNWQKPK